MNIRNKSVLILGGFGLVGSAIAKKIIKSNPSRIIISSLRLSEAEEAVKNLHEQFPEKGKNYFVPLGGDVFVRNEFKNIPRGEILSDPKKRKVLMSDIMDELSDEILKKSSLYTLTKKYKPDIIIDCINTATAIAYQDIYTSYRHISKQIKNKAKYEDIISSTEMLLCTLYIPQLIRHVQLLYTCMINVNTETYIKIGTSGTGGMGLNIPYTHSEEKPSRVLLSKSSIAGAHTLLLFLMARTPEGPITKEIKPTGAIAWKKIEFGEIKRNGKPIELYDVPLTQAVKLNKKLELKTNQKYKKSGKVLKSVFIDTGENGIFSKGEFETITAQKQMEFVTPEEIADVVIFEIRGGNTGHDIVSSLDHATMEPTYRAGYMQHAAVNKLNELEKINGVDSVAFELLGPPRLSKLLYEIYLISLIHKSMKDVIKDNVKSLSEKCNNIIVTNDTLRNQIISIGIPILLPDGNTLLRAENIKIPPFRGENELVITKENKEKWATEGWVDLRTSNIKRWQKRLSELIKEAEAISDSDTSSTHVRTKTYWNNYEELNIGRICSWLFIHEEKGLRMKS
ncbi:MAG: short-chain dehydrogenase [Ignavibacteriales bacterium CG12_big_fil_rev_8_21_14_0_65_30_8]|nr:MAG: short-chain dehydrogenase [Ignavibacteriales bacterium CG12_big_fil_rev_8_21_14_0_65_30_8]